MTVTEAMLERALSERREAIEERDRLRILLREAIEVVHQTGLIRNHADPTDRTGWNVKGVETCADPLCVEALAALDPK